MSRSEEKCGVHDCYSRCPFRQFFCNFHYEMLPLDVVQAMRASWVDGQQWNTPFPSVDWKKSIAAAIGWIRGKREKDQRAALVIPVPIIERVTKDTGPSGPAVGFHFMYRGKYGYLPPPPWAGQGLCWWCKEKCSIWPPLCRACASFCWDADIFKPQALAGRGIVPMRNAR